MLLSLARADDNSSLFLSLSSLTGYSLSGRWRRRRLPQTQKLAMKDLKADAGKTSRQAEVNGLFVVQRLHSDSGLNTVEQLPSDYMWDMVEEFEERLQEYKKASPSFVVLGVFIWFRMHVSSWGTHLAIPQCYPRYGKPPRLRIFFSCFSGTQHVSIQS